MSCNWAKDGSFSEQDISRESSLLPGPLWIFFTNFHKEPFTVWQFLGKSEKFSKFLRTQTVWFARLKHSRIYEEAEESDHFQHQLQFHPKKWYNCVWKSTGFSNELLNSFETFQRQVDWKLSKCQTSDWTFEIKNTIPRCGVKDQQDINKDQDPVQVRIQNHVMTVICKLNLTGVHISGQTIMATKKAAVQLVISNSCSRRLTYRRPAPPDDAEWREALCLTVPFSGTSWISSVEELKHLEQDSCCPAGRIVKDDERWEMFASFISFSLHIWIQACIPFISPHLSNLNPSSYSSLLTSLQGHKLTIYFSAAGDRWPWRTEWRATRTPRSSRWRTWTRRSERPSGCGATWRTSPSPREATAPSI